MKMKRKMKLIMMVICLFVLSHGVVPLEASSKPNYSEDLCNDQSKVSASSSYNGNIAGRAFDNASTAWNVNAWESARNMPQWISYDFEVPKRIQKYTLTPSPNYIQDMPQDWEFQGSNDSETWTTIQQVTGYSDWASDHSAKEFYVNNTQSFRYYRLYVTRLHPSNGNSASSGYLIIGEIEMMEKIGNDQSSFNNHLYILLAEEEEVNLAAFLLGTTEQQNLNWTSETMAVATVNNNGTVTAVEAGTTMISVSSEDGYFIASCKIKVIDEVLPPTDGALRLMVLLTVGDSFRLELEGDEQVMVTWSSDDNTIASVDTWLNQNRRGTVTAISEGTTFITASDATQSEIIYVRVEP